MKNLIMIYTPYQLMSALSILDNEIDGQTDIILMHKSLLKYENELTRKINGTVIYEEKLIDSKNLHNRFCQHIAIFCRIIKKMRILFRGTVIATDYNKLFVPSDDNTCRVVYSYLLKLNKNIQLFLFDDGIGTYADKLFVSKSWISQIIYSIFLENNFYERISGIYCYHPELVYRNPYNKPIKSIHFSIQRSLFEPYLKEALKSYIGKKVIVLDQGFSDKNIVEAFKHLLKYFDTSEVLIKIHPRLSQKSSFPGFQTCSDGLPFEAISSSLEINNCLIISYSSTGCITPFLLQSKNPFAIMLFKLGDVNRYYIVQEVIDKINSGDIKRKIMMPDSITEFDHLIESIHNEVESITLE